VDVYYNQQFLEIYGKHFGYETEFINIDTKEFKFKCPCLIDYESRTLTNPYGYGGPWLIKGNWDEAFAMLDLVCDLRDLDKIGFRLHLFNGNYKMPGAEFNRKNVYVDVKDCWDNIYKNIDKYKRKNCRRAERRGLKFRESDDIETFKKVYEHKLTQNVAKPFYFFPIEYYQDLIKYGFAKIYEVVNEHEDVIVSSMLLFDNRKNNHIVVYDYLRGSMEGYENLYPSDFALIKLIERNHQHAFSYYVLGGGNYQNDSQFRFKSCFSQYTKDFYVFNKEVKKNV